MALDFQKVREEIKKLGANARERQEQLDELREKASDLLKDNSDNIEEVRRKVAQAAAQNKNLRSALPVAEPLAASFPLPEIPQSATIIAADGSQINPDRHSAVDYCLVNVGAIQMSLGSADAPEPVTQTELYYDEAMYTPNGTITEGMLALIRDQREREVLAELAANAEQPVITLTDGPIELWEGEHSQEFSRRFKMYLKSLSKLRQTGAITAGFVDKPRSDLVVRMLELADTEDSDLKEAGKKRKFRGVSDIKLFSNFLEPGERTAIFGLQSPSASKYAEELALHFFYLNISMDKDDKKFARVEIPAWVVDNVEMLDQLHAILVAQCQIIGNAAHPYLLHRAHEIALVTRTEKELVENMIAMELRQRGMDVGSKSGKQQAKDNIRI